MIYSEEYWEEVLEENEEDTEDWHIGVCPCCNDYPTYVGSRYHHPEYKKVCKECEVETGFGMCGGI